MNLWVAVRNNDLKSVRTILEDSQGDGINTPDNNGQTPLYWAACNNNIEMVRLLLDNGVKGSVNTPNLCGRTPLCWAAQRGNIEMVRLLLAGGAQESINAPNNNSLTPLYWAVCHNYIEMARLLLDNGAWVRDMVFGAAKGDVRALLERHRLALSEVNTLLLSVQRKIDTLAGNPDNASYDSAALLGGDIPALIFSYLSAPVTNNENQEGANVKVREEGSGDGPQADQQRNNKTRHAM